MISLQKLKLFMSFLHKVQNVKRVARIPDEEEYRSTAEHTFELVLLCWHIADSNKLELNHEKILKYALAHDLLEAYAGDSYIYDAESQKTKKNREEKAIKRIAEEFSEFPDLLEHIHAYEEREDDESKFVYATDKLIDPLNISMETGETLWKKLNISYKDLRTYKDHKIKQSEHILPYWEELTDALEPKQDFFFKNK